MSTTSQRLTWRFANKELAELARLTWPVLVGLLANAGMGALDIAMAGHVSAEDLAGVSLGVSIWHIITVTLIGWMVAVNPFVAHHAGAGEFKRIPGVVRDGLWMGAIVGLGALLLTLMATSIFDWMAIEPRVRDIAKEFLWVIAFALPAFALFRVLYGYCTSLGKPWPVAIVALVGWALSAFFNWCFVFGNLGFSAMGGVGCAWSNLIAAWVSLLMLAVWIALDPAFKASYPFDRLAWPTRSGLSQMMRMGATIAITFFAETSAFSLIALLVAKFGAVEVSAHQIALNCVSLVFMVPMSMGVALLTRVGQALGAGQAQQARLRAWVGVVAAFAFGLASAIAILLFRSPIANLYTNDAMVAQHAAALLVLAAIFQLSDSSQVVLANAIRAYKATRVPMAIHLTAFWVVCLPLGCWLGLAPGWLPAPPWGALKALGFWIALIVGLSVAALALLAYLRHVSGQALGHHNRKF